VGKLYLYLLDLINKFCSVFVACRFASIPNKLRATLHTLKKIFKKLQNVVCFAPTNIVNHKKDDSTTP
jgi:hypothetical protein